MSFGQDIDIAVIGVCLCWLVLPPWLGASRALIAALLSLVLWVIIVTLAFGAIFRKYA